MRTHLTCNIFFGYGRQTFDGVIALPYQPDVYADKVNINVCLKFNIIFRKEEKCVCKVVETIKNCGESKSLQNCKKCDQKYM